MGLPESDISSIIDGLDLPPMLTVYSDGHAALLEAAMVQNEGRKPKAEALERVATGYITKQLLDLGMPESDCHEVLAEVQMQPLLAAQRSASNVVAALLRALMVGISGGSNTSDRVKPLAKRFVEERLQEVGVAPHDTSHIADAVDLKVVLGAEDVYRKNKVVLGAETSSISTLNAVMSQLRSSSDASAKAFVGILRGVARTVLKKRLLNVGVNASEANDAVNDLTVESSLADAVYGGERGEQGDYALVHDIWGQLNARGDSERATTAVIERGASSLIKRRLMDLGFFVRHCDAILTHIPISPMLAALHNVQTRDAPWDSDRSMQLDAALLKVLLSQLKQEGDTAELHTQIKRRAKVFLTREFVNIGFNASDSNVLGDQNLQPLLAAASQSEAALLHAVASELSGADRKMDQAVDTVARLYVARNVMEVGLSLSESKVALDGLDLFSVLTAAMRGPAATLRAIYSSASVRDGDAASPAVEKAAKRYLARELIGAGLTWEDVQTTLLGGGLQPLLRDAESGTGALLKAVRQQRGVENEPLDAALATAETKLSRQ